MGLKWIIMGLKRVYYVFLRYDNIKMMIMQLWSSNSKLNFEHLGWKMFVYEIDFRNDMTLNFIRIFPELFNREMKSLLINLYDSGHVLPDFRRDEIASASAVLDTFMIRLGFSQDLMSEADFGIFYPSFN